MKSLLLVLLGFSMVSCFEKKEFTKDSISDFSYEFHDSSVPPEYHRSYVISVMEGSASIKVDSYGDILHNKSYEITDQDYAELIALLNKADLTSCDVVEAEPCSGATSEKLVIFEGDAQYSAYLDHCGDKEFPSNCGNLRAVINKMKSFIPDLSELLQ